VKKLSANFTSGYENFNVNFNLDVDCGLVCLVGPNASGKSTIIKTILGLLKPKSGVVRIDGYDVFRLSNVERARKVSAVLSEKPNLPMMKVIDVIILGRTPYREITLSKRDYEIVEKVLEVVGIKDLAEKLFNELSDGQRQKVLIARALAQETKVIILDEPTTHLDPKAKHEVMSILRKLANNDYLIIVTLHDLELLPYCDLVIGIKNGKIIFTKCPEEIEEEELEELYDMARNDDIKPKVHVFAGLGTGKNIYITLWKMNIPFSTGIVHREDIDYYYAKKFASKVYTELSDEFLREVENVKVIIDSGFPINELTKRNYESLIKLSNSNDKTILTFRENAKWGVKIKSLIELKKLIAKFLQGLKNQ